MILLVLLAIVLACVCATRAHVGARSISPDAAAARRVAVLESRRLDERLAATRDAEADAVRWLASLADDRVRLGDAYARGMYPHFAPSPDLARACYEDAARHGDVVGAARLAEAAVIEPIDVAIGAPALPIVAWAPQQHDRGNRYVPRDDAQNVHDHAVVACVADRIDDLRVERAAAHDETLAEVVDAAFALQDVDDATKARAVDVALALGSAAHSKYGISEREALARVWHRIHGIGVDDVKRNATETLVRQLADCKERGSTVCSAGKIARIVGALDGVSEDDETRLRPVWAIREELAREAARIRDDHDDPAAMAEALRAHARREYVDALGMARTVVDPVVDELCVGFD